MPPSLKLSSYVATSTSGIPFCMPAMVHFVIGFIALIMISFQNFSVIVLLFKGFFLFVWTWLLDLLCRNGYANVSWFLVLFPYISMLLFAVFFETHLKLLKIIPHNAIPHHNAMDRNLLY
jgi:hypothetical protein